MGNEKDIHGALSNILFNAVKHNPQGAEIKLSVTRRHQGVMISLKMTAWVLIVLRFPV